MMPLEALTDVHRELRDQILTIFYDFYKKLKLFKQGLVSKLAIQYDFDHITQIKKRKVSGGTKTKMGTYSWDVGLSLVHTCRKLKISFYDYLKDRYSLVHELPKLSDLVLAS